MDLIPPPVLRPGATVGLIAPASAPRDLDRAARGIETLEELGYEIRGERSWPRAVGYLSAPDRVRAEAANRAFADPDLSALIAVRGGFGCLRILSDLAFEELRRSPKLIVGYSDVSALQLAALARAGVPSLAGPMVDPDWAEIDSWSRDRFLDAVGREGAGDVPLTGPDSEVHVLRRGRGEGVLIVSNLTLLTRLLGTPYLPDLAGAILLVEDVGEPPYRIDGMLAQLALAGVLEEVSGLLFGRFSDAESEGPTLSLDAVLEEYADRVAGPVVASVAYGHRRPSGSFPVGVPAVLEAEDESARLRTRTSSPGGPSP